MVNAGDILEYSGSITSGFTQSVAGVLAELTANLEAKGYQVYSSTSPGAGILGNIEAALSFSGTSENISLKFSVPSSYGTADDVKAIVDGEIYSITGTMPIASSIVDQGPSTLEPSPASVSSGLSLSSLSAGLAGAGAGTLVGIVLAVVAIFFILDYKAAP